MNQNERNNQDIDRKKNAVEKLWMRLVHYFAVTAAGIMLTASMAGCSSMGVRQEYTSAEEEKGTTRNEQSDTGLEELEPVSRDIFAMDTYMTLTAYGEDAGKALDAAKEEIQRIEELVSTGIPTSEVSRINEKGEADVSEDTDFLIQRSKELYDDTDGAFDITVYPVMKAWGFTTGKYRIPKKEELQKLLANMGAGEVSSKDGHVAVGKPGMQIDLGGIAKGYTSDRVMSVFREYDIRHAVISLGGNVHTLNAKPDGSSWKVAVEDPEDTSDYIGIIEVKNKAVITSGGYERYFEQDGKTYHHIIDPSTGYPADSGLISVTIVSEDGTLADGLSTSLFIMGKEKAEEYWRRHADVFDVILVENNGSVSVSEGIADAFSSGKDWNIIHK